jgi:hypothetical protein
MGKIIKQHFEKKYSVTRETERIYDGERLVAINTQIHIRMGSENPSAPPPDGNSVKSKLPVIADIIISLLGALCFYVAKKVKKGE